MSRSHLAVDGLVVALIALTLHHQYNIGIIRLLTFQSISDSVSGAARSASAAAFSRSPENFLIQTYSTFCLLCQCVSPNFCLLSDALYAQMDSCRRQPGSCFTLDKKIFKFSRILYTKNKTYLTLRYEKIVDEKRFSPDILHLSV